MDRQKDPNKLFQARLDKGEVSLRILLSQGQGTKTAPVPADAPVIRTEGVNPRRRPDEETLARRKKAGYIQFWDLGQILDGDDFVDIPFFSVPVDDGGDFNHADMSDAEWFRLRDIILAVDPETLETQFKKLEYEEAERYGLDIFANGTTNYPVARNGSRYEGSGNTVVAGTKWTSSGLQVPGPLTSVYIDSFGAFMIWETGVAATKWTTTPDFSDPDVGEISIQPNAKVFLMPRIIGPLSVAGNGLGDSDVMIGPFQPLQRSFWLGRNYESTGYPVLAYAGFPITDDLTDTDKLALIEHLRINALEWDNIGGDHGDASAWPIYNTTAFSDVMGSTSSEIPDPNLSYPSGALLAIIKQGGTTYYGWSVGGGGYNQGGRLYDYTGLV